MWLALYVAHEVDYTTGSSVWEITGSSNQPTSCIGAMIGALRATGNAFCLQAASKLSVLRLSTKSYNLHLRDAGLSLDDVKLIAEVMCKGAIGKDLRLLSSSMSYNTNITDMGVQTLVGVFPHSITDLGFVGYGLGDEAGLTMLGWATTAKNLRLICIEHNNFSVTLKDEFFALGKKKPSLSVVI